MYYATPQVFRLLVFFEVVPRIALHARPRRTSTGGTAPERLIHEGESIKIEVRLAHLCFHKEHCSINRCDHQVAR